MAEKPKGWSPRVIEGGKSEKASTNKPESQETNHVISDEANIADELTMALQGEWIQMQSPESDDSSEIGHEGALIRLYMDLSRNSPANFGASVRPELVQQAATILPSWSVGALHKYLAGGEIWKRPSFTKAVFEEIRERMLLGKMSPRE